MKFWGLLNFGCTLSLEIYQDRHQLPRHPLGRKSLWHESGLKIFVG